jgi:hydrogenase maturation protease
MSDLLNAMTNAYEPAGRALEADVDARAGVLPGHEWRTLVLGIGNLLAGDDGLGPIAIERLVTSSPEFPPGTEIVDGGTCGLFLLAYLAGVDSLVAIDAAELGAEPGTVRVLRDIRPSDPVMCAPHMSIHQAGLADMLSAARLARCLPGRVTLVGVQPSVITDMTIGLSAPVAATFELCCATVIEEAWAAFPAGRNWSESHLSRAQHGRSPVIAQRGLAV